MNALILCSIGKMIGYGMILYSVNGIAKSLLVKEHERPEQEQGTVLSPRRRRG